MAELNHTPDRLLPSISKDLYNFSHAVSKGNDIGYAVAYEALRNYTITIHYFKECNDGYLIDMLPFTQPSLEEKTWFIEDVRRACEESAKETRLKPITDFCDSWRDRVEIGKDELNSIKDPDVLFLYVAIDGLHRQITRYAPVYLGDGEKKLIENYTKTLKDICESLEHGKCEELYKKVVELDMFVDNVVYDEFVPSLDEIKFGGRDAEKPKSLTRRIYEKLASVF